jgi:GT2 family glycosyltransferase
MSDITLTAGSIAAIIVTRNRLALLQESVQAVRQQTRPADEIIVVNNDSDDGTREWLDSQQGLTVIHQANLGGAGGFYQGLKTGHQRGHDWFWCMDDDTIPQAEALERLCATPYFQKANTGYLGSMVQWTDGSPHKMNMWFDAPQGAENIDWYTSVLDDKCVPSRTSSFVSILISRAAVEKVGLPIKEMFIWADDAEYTLRISQYFKNYHVLDSIVLHKTASNHKGTIATATPADYFKLKYGLRNEVYFRRQQQKSPIGKFVTLALLLTRHTLLLLKARAPFYLIKSLWSGLFFSPRIEQVSGQSPTAAHP